MFDFATRSKKYCSVVGTIDSSLYIHQNLLKVVVIDNWNQTWRETDQLIGHDMKPITHHENMPI